ncbi:MAG: hypothetical protein P9L94_08840 [Candidatus Hinthialibacter antarcticus]|nr:hypothetical protein [Candidatus Hinthialibacter antarcticus]
MTPKDINQVVANSLGAIIILSLLAWPVFGLDAAFGCLFGGLASAVNLWLLKSLIEEAMGPCRSFRIFLYILVKLPVFYGLGAFILLTMKVALLPALAAFQVPFLFVLLESLRGGREAGPTETAAETKVEVD